MAVRFHLLFTLLACSLQRSLSVFPISIQAKTPDTLGHFPVPVMIPEANSEGQFLTTNFRSQRSALDEGNVGWTHSVATLSVHEGWWMKCFCFDQTIFLVELRIWIEDWKNTHIKWYYHPHPVPEARGCGYWDTWIQLLSSFLPANASESLFFQLLLLYDTWANRLIQLLGQTVSLVNV